MAKFLEEFKILKPLLGATVDLMVKQCEQEEGINFQKFNELIKD